MIDSMNLIFLKRINHAQKKSPIVCEAYCLINQRTEVKSFDSDPK